MKKIIFTSILGIMLALFLVNSFVIAQGTPSIEIIDMAITNETNTYGLAVQINARNIPAGTKVDIAIDLNLKDSKTKYNFDVLKQVCFDKTKTESNMGWKCVHEVHQDMQVDFEIVNGDGQWLMLEIPKEYLDDGYIGKYYPAVGVWKTGKVGDADCTEDYLGSVVETGCDFDQFVREDYLTTLPLDFEFFNKLVLISEFETYYPCCMGEWEIDQWKQVGTEAFEKAFKEISFMIEENNKGKRFTYNFYMDTYNPADLRNKVGFYTLNELYDVDNLQCGTEDKVMHKGGCLELKETLIPKSKKVFVILETTKNRDLCYFSILSKQGEGINVYGINIIPLTLTKLSGEKKCIRGTV